MARRRDAGISEEEGGENSGSSHALSLILSIGQGEEGGGVAWFYQEELERLARAVDSNPRTRGDCS